jgi:hypothetical protein
LKAYATIDETIANKLANEMGLDSVPPPDEDETDDSILNRPLLDSAGGGEEVKEKLLILEKTGEDYDVGKVLF